ncbi:hypothetical protein THAOC_01571, partial [Thalassiosira oceanica]
RSEFLNKFDADDTHSERWSDDADRQGKSEVIGELPNLADEQNEQRSPHAPSLAGVGSLIFVEDCCLTRATAKRESRAKGRSQHTRPGKGRHGERANEADDPQVPPGRGPREAERDGLPDPRGPQRPEGGLGHARRHRPLPCSGAGAVGGVPAPRWTTSSA